MFLVLHVLTTEKAVGAIEKENKLTFIVMEKSTKPELKKEIETRFGEKVEKITTIFAPNGRKKAMVRFKRPGAASDLAARLKVI
ncbi:50S ribosomal protein L23 [Candidatus Micrarchaeota archaeon]|nr:50S ribosomal protein L23 [Candidatus Micrarchaeota archaeon]